MIDASQFLVIADYPGIHRVSRAQHLSIDAFTGTPPAALTGSARWAVHGHGELGFNRWKKIWVYPSVPGNSQPWTARCGDRYDPQPVKRNSE